MSETKYLSMGLAALMGCTGLAMVVGVYMEGKEDVARLDLEKAVLERGYSVQERDLNRDGPPERVFEVDGKKYFLAVDGKNVEDTIGE